MLAWSRDSRCRVSEGALRKRLQIGWDSERALTTPRDQKSFPRAITAFGETMSLSAWARAARCMVPPMTLFNRLGRGWPPEEALTTPPRQQPPSSAGGT